MTRHHLVCVGHPTDHTSEPRVERSEPLLCRHCTLSTVLRDVLALASLRRRTTSTSCVGAKKSSQSHTTRTRAQFSRCHSPRLAATGAVSLSHMPLVSGIRACPSRVLPEAKGLVRSRLTHQAMVRDHLLNRTRDDIDPKHYGDQKLRF
jgi:hypothetical protein